ncbi:MAG: DUF2459 domain-containing protein [Candidatus Binatia bacterium]
MLKTLRYLTAFLLVSCCAAAVEDVPLSAQGETGKRIFVVNHGWHSGIVIKKAEIPGGLLPEAADFPGAESLEIGWGDWDYYQAPDPGVASAIKAAFFSSRSVVHVGGFSGAVEDYFRGAEVFALTVSEEGFRRLNQFVSDSFLRSESQPLEKPRDGLYPNSRFYPARGKFHLFRNCNTWVAEALQAAGLPIRPTYVITVENLSYQVKRMRKDSTLGNKPEMKTTEPNGLS